MKCADYFWLRSAGFPADSLLQTTSFSNRPEFTTLTELHQRRERLLQLFEQHIATVGEEQCRKFARKLTAQQAVSVSDLPLLLRDILQQPLAEWHSVNVEITEREASLRLEFSSFSEQVRQQLIDFLSRADVAEAIFISNSDAAQRIGALVTERNAPNDSRKKQKIRLGWNYAQRFCTKNDTCSFFGPIAWGRFADQQTALAHVDWAEGPWLAQRETFFESWVMQRLAAQINAQCPEPACLPLTLNPGCYLHGDVLHYPLNKSRRLTGSVLNVLSALAKGKSNEIQLRAKLDSNPGPVLEHLITAGIIQRGFQLSPRDPDALTTLLQAMHEATLPAYFIAQWSACFQRLEAQRKIYASGNLQRRQQALTALNQALSEAGVSLARESGKMYVGRYPVYEDCACASTVTFNRTLQKELETDFAPLMALYQWLTRATGVLLHQAWLEVYQANLSSTHEQDSSLLSFLHTLQPRQKEIQQQVCEQIRVMLDNAWQPLLSSLHTNELHLSTEQVAQVLTALNQQCPAAADFSVFGNDFHSPDFMLAAASQEALNRGEYLVVLGETHPGVHTLSQPIAAPFCPFTTEIEQAVNALFGRKRIILADSPDNYQRSHIDWPLVPHYAQLILPTGGGSVPEERCYPVGRARLHCKAGRLTVEDLDGVFQEDLLCVNSTALHQLLFQLAGDVVPRRDPRRIQVNRTVYKRRTWVFNTNEWPLVSTDEFTAFIQWQNWQQRQGLPRWVFIKCESEPKPLFIDFDNPLSLDALATALKKAKVIHVSEMLPAPDDLWLNDARGRVCCEVRTTFSSIKQEVLEYAE
ncbi:lantibiotic dehydratase [Xenorhabdus sp. 12]|uniref:Lantibiotic dehydratase n=1 Tax=Xenorhabdus santafensis TaxID=2582833 RepID=A0ABU4S517_9GAMM|nr:lantibiotic dehydratase [Xenorhabdus sp. 12]MDX7986305.1 lantibiotic dehydratase [Xenorhabdus sp. 12]